MKTNRCTKLDPIYHRFCHIVERCENPKRKDYRYYGAKGVRVSEEWRYNFSMFKEWFCQKFEEFLAQHNGEFYSPSEMAVDRIDSKGPYSPSNCRLLTRSENSRIAQKARWAKIKEAKNANRN